jgi:acyl carrier protein
MNTSVTSLLRFVNEELLAARTDTIGPDTLLFEEGGIDSLKILQLLAFLELKSGRKIPDELIVMERFRTVKVIAENFLS